MFLIRTKAVHQFPGQPVGHSEAIGISHLGAVELESAAVRGQVHQLEAQRCRAFVPVDGKVLHRPLAPFPHSGNSDATGPVPVPAHQHPVVASSGTVHHQQVERGDIPSQPGDHLKATLQRRGHAPGQVPPILSRCQRWNRLDAALGLPHRRAIVVHLDGFLQRSVRCIGLAGSHFKFRAAVSGVAKAVHDKARFHPGRMGGRIVYGYALHARPLQGIPYALGIVGPPVETVDPLARRDFHTPARHPVRARVRPR